MSTFTIKRGDTSPALVYALAPASVVLTGAAVVFTMARLRASSPTIDRAAAVIEAATGAPTVAYEWAGTDTAVAGVYAAEFEVTYADGAVETFPNAGHLLIEIVDDLG